ncbi:hypothetical protein MMC16_004861 [Acarospora aff. strigata]|nr:hypothetical protein [Acarospora aff. strigata]
MEGNGGSGSLADAENLQGFSPENAGKETVQKGAKMKEAEEHSNILSFAEQILNGDIQCREREAEPRYPDSKSALQAMAEYMAAKRVALAQNKGDHFAILEEAARIRGERFPLGPARGGKDDPSYVSESAESLDKVVGVPAGFRHGDKKDDQYMSTEDASKGEEVVGVPTGSRDDTMHTNTASTSKEEGSWRLGSSHSRS